MATQVVNSRRQAGGSLVELLVASLIGLMAISIVGSVYLAGQKMAIERAKVLMLTQNLSSVVQQIKEDAQRAGYDGVGSSSLTLSGASSSLYTQSSPDLLGYVYRVASVGSHAFRSVVYKREASSVSTQGDMLKVCEKHSPSILVVSAASTSGTGGYCFNLFDPKQISISQFELESQLVEGTTASSQWLTLLITGHLVSDNSIEYQTSIELMQRNWQ
ncbi:PilW family protein [Vibrio sp. TBV020]|uniref:PilW family protein n=1 Tax=Vibrio sp. TBV020 TaxID=3137398 RepID=UPI0038CD95BF